MTLISTTNEYSIEGVVQNGDKKQTVVLTSNFEGTQQGYSEMSVEAIVEDLQGHKQRCVCIKNMDNASLPEPPEEDGTYTLKVETVSGKKVYTWVAE